MGHLLSADRAVGVLVGLASLLALPLATPAPAADLYGLVIGVDDYEYEPDLGGAAADAQDVASALKTAGAREVRLLINREVTRRGVLDAWSALVAAAKTGDTLVFSYAGHGSQVEEFVAGSEGDGLDEILVLSRFNHDDARSTDYILDDEINLMFREAGHLNVLFVADACYSGTLTRSVDARTRSIPVVPRRETFVTSSPDAASIAVKELPNVTFLSASQEDQQTPELLIGGTYRGALSWAFSRALRGAADRDQDGWLSRAELERYVIENVRMKAQGLQNPRFEPSFDQRFAAVTGKNVIPIGLRSEGSKARIERLERPLALAVIGVTREQAATLVGGLNGVELVVADATADLTWNRLSGRVNNAIGDTIAQSVDKSPAFVQAVADKIRLVEAVHRLSERRPLALRLVPDKGHFRKDETLSVTVDSGGLTHLAVIAVSSDGEVNLMFPDKNGTTPVTANAGWVEAGTPLSIELQVGPPYGADHLIAIATPEPRPALWNDIARFNGTRGALALEALLINDLSGTEYAMGAIGLYTYER
jgi:hypothetical protein